MPISISEMVMKLDVASNQLNGLSLSGKIAELRRSRSDDRIQQLQSEAIVELYDAVRQIQLAIWPMLSRHSGRVGAGTRRHVDDGKTQAATAIHAMTGLRAGSRSSRVRPACRPS